MTLTMSESQIDEAGNTTSRPTIKLSNPTFETVTVTLSYGGTASTGDYNNNAPTTINLVSPGDQITPTEGVTAVQDNDSEGNETVIVSVTNLSGGGAVEATQQEVTVTIIDDDNVAPALAGLGGTVNFTENGSAVPLDTDVSVTDTELDADNSNAGNYNGASITITRSGGVNADDRYANTGQLGTLTEGQPLVYNSQNYGTVTTNSGGTLKLTFSNSSQTPTTAIVNAIMRAVTYSNASDAPDTSVVLNWVFNDGTSDSTGTNQTTVSVEPVNDAPVLDAAQSPTLASIAEDAGDDDGDASDDTYAA